LDEEQAGFKRARNTVQQILTSTHRIYNCFIDFTKAFNTVIPDLVWAVLHSYEVDEQLVRVIKQAYLQALLSIRVRKDMGTLCAIPIGTKQGDPVSPTAFITYLERWKRYSKQRDKGRQSRASVSITCVC